MTNIGRGVFNFGHFSMRRVKFCVGAVKFCLFCLVVKAIDTEVKININGGMAKSCMGVPK